MPDEPLKRWVAWSQILANFAIVFTLAVTAVTYYFYLQSERRDASLDWVGRFAEGPILAAREDLADTWARTGLADLPGPVDVEVIKALDRATDRSAAEEERISRAVLRLADFFDGAAACLEERICDVCVMQAHLGAYARDFWALYDDRIAALRQSFRNAALGAGVRGIVEADATRRFPWQECRSRMAGRGAR